MIAGTHNGHSNAFISRIPTAMAGGVSHIPTATVNIALTSGKGS